VMKTYNWSSFYEGLCHHGPNLLIGLDEEAHELIEIESSSSDMFWSDGLEEMLAEGVANGDIRAGVISALELWRENVLEALETNFGFELDWQTVSVDTNSQLINELVMLASPR
jgi:hypothetical protein